MIFPSMKANKQESILGPQTQNANRMTPMRHFLDLKDFSTDTLQSILDVGLSMKVKQKSGDSHELSFSGKTVAMIFEKPSTRTRVSFEVGITQLGGTPLVLSASDLQIGRGESIEDTARVLSRYVNAIVIRCYKHETLLTLAKHASVPVINALTNWSHPCQLMADLMTMIEYHGPLAGQTVAWLGDGNNVAVSWIEAAVHFGFHLRIAGPQRYAPPAGLLAWARANGGDIMLTDDVSLAIDKVQTVVTDVWVSMGADEGSRRKDFAPYQVNAKLMKSAAGDAIFMHCLPAQRGMEVTAEVIDGPQSAVFDEAENRLHAQKAVMLWCLEGY
uniref:Ornithine carbamoyltransferase n=1 Tax=uncultured alpha proteobacterium EBAC2C11 TaxID=295349 RepID=Q5UF33_9PROT|nr:ornithine carbamoyltransferase [uncultured alpha proteobacterium EBAC2C11]